jgi:hypothetical protein
MAISRLRPKAVLDRSASADLFRHTLARIPCMFGRLMYFGSLRDPNTGVYHHYGLTSAFGREQSIEALRLSHLRTFREWLRLPLREKHADLEAYLESLDDPKGLVVGYWLESEGYMGCIPQGASKADREYYSNDLKRLLRGLSVAAGGGSRGLKSSRRK